jgi:ketol-acid reductoisomerase
MINQGVEKTYAAKLIQNGWEVITEELKHGGITKMMDRLSDNSKIKAFKISEDLKVLMRPLFKKHMHDIMSGEFSKTMMLDWKNNDKNLLKWRAETGETLFEKTNSSNEKIDEQQYFDHGIAMIAFVRSGVELAFETMVDSGIIDSSAYYESLHELPLIANTVARKKLFEMNRIISDTAEYGCYLFDHACKPLLKDFVNDLPSNTIGNAYDTTNDFTDSDLIDINSIISSHPIEKIGKTLRNSMKEMKKII